MKGFKPWKLRLLWHLTWFLLAIMFYHDFTSFLIIALYFLILAVIAKTFNLTVELVIPIGISTKEAKAEIETYPVTAETEMSKCSI